MDVGTWALMPGRPARHVITPQSLLCLGNPAFHAAGRPDLLANLVTAGSKARDLPVVEDAKIVELF